MRYIILAFSLLSFTSLNCVEIVKKEEVSYFRMEKIKFCGHTYIHFRNEWNSVDSHMWHDPDCETCIAVLKRLTEKKQ